jgi:alpha-L-rhamnosidase
MKAALLIFLVSLCNLARAETATGSATTTACPAPTGLSCELLLDPAKTVIYDPRPEFSWECGSGDQAFLQSACQIMVRSVSTNGPGEIVWDSGRLDGSDSLNIEYAGIPLRPDAWYTWQVRAWNHQQQPSEWSELQRFRMAETSNAMETSRYPVIKVEQFAQSIQMIDQEKYLIDFGTAAFGYLKLRVTPADASRELRITFGEKLAGGRVDRNPGGSIRTYRVDAVIPANTAEIEVRPPRDRRNTTGDAIRLPPFAGVIAPFRYVEMRGLAERPDQQDLVQVRIEYPFDENAASFKSADTTLNAVWDLCKYSIRATTFCGVYVDGDRERIPYEADAYINQLSHYGVDREYALARFSHEYLLEKPTWPTEWKQHSVLMASADYWYTGDSESLERCYEILKREKILTAAEREDGLVDTSGDYRDIVDWPEAERDGYEMLPVNTVVNAFHYATLTRIAYLAGVLGRAEDQALFTAKAEKFKAVFNAVFWNQDTGRYVDGEGSLHSSLHANLFPLAFELVPKERCDSVVEFVKSRQMQCSVYAAQYLLEGLYLAGEDQYALDLLTSRDKRSWFNMIRSGSTITLEAWDQQFKPNLDWNHAWGAAPANLIASYLVGVTPEEPGFKKILVQPRPGDLQSFAAKVPTPRGAVQVRYSRKQTAVRLDIEVPGNSTARTGIPLGVLRQPLDVVHNGHKVPVRVGATHAWIDDVPPGKHSFQMSTSPTMTRVTLGNTTAN